MGLASSPQAWGCSEGQTVFLAALHEPRTLSCLSPCGDGSLECEHPLCLGVSGCFLQPLSSASSQRLRCSGAGVSSLPLPGGCSGCLHHTLPVPAMGGSAVRGCAMGGSAARALCKPSSFPVPTWAVAQAQRVPWLPLPPRDLIHPEERTLPARLPAG